MTRATLAAAAATTLSAVALSGCSVLPALPEATPSSWLPEPTASAELPDFISENGFTPGELAAYRIRNFGCEESATGSAFAIDSHTLITNEHVTEGYYIISANASDGEDIATSGTVIAKIGDLAIITTDQELPYTVTLADGDAEIGDDITVVGFPNGDEMTTSTGRVLAEVEDTLDNAEFIYETDAYTKSGSSGSAVYNDNWEVVGVLYAGDLEGVEHSYFVPVSILQEFLDDDSTQKVRKASC